jgi:hypothetical protein
MLGSAGKLHANKTPPANSAQHFNVEIKIAGLILNW